MLWFGIYDAPTEINERDFPTAENTGYGDWNFNVSRAEYRAQIARIKDYIAAGDTYQVNHTVRLKNESFQPDTAWPFFLNTFLPLDSEFSAYIETDAFAIASGSPELFFEQDGPKLTCRPMKGTIRRGAYSLVDNREHNLLGQSQKDRAENVMIVDMIRNDLGRIAQPGTVHTTRLFDLEKYATVWQMTSTVTAETETGITDIFKALFPCASITGAPKVRTMELIRELEQSPRGIYTGCIGYIAPNRQARFNVAIRTLAIDKNRGTAEYGTGGGIVWDSEADLEFAECEAKALTLTESRPRFQLLETLLFEPSKGIFLLEKHLERLEQAANYFNFKCDLPAVEKELADFRCDKFARLRLLVSRDGQFELQHVPLGKEKPAIEHPWKLKIAASSVDTRNPFLYHKTTHRTVYKKAKAGCEEADDVVLFNENGEVTETTIANIVIEKRGQKFTPPISCGLLNGTFRQHLLETGRITEKAITVDDLKNADQIWLINSVRGWVPAGL
ncbi:aminodeoxychorismate synthase component I [Verrucomicrobiota bacterium]